MSKQKPLTIEIEETIKVNPAEIYRAKVVKSGNGAVVKSFKRFIGKKVIIIVEGKNIMTKQKTKEEEEQELSDLREDAREGVWKKA